MPIEVPPPKTEQELLSDEKLMKARRGMSILLLGLKSEAAMEVLCVHFKKLNGYEKYWTRQNKFNKAAVNDGDLILQK